MHTVEFYYPSVGGAQEVVRQISERLVRLGHDVTIATTKLPDRTLKVLNGVKIVEFDISGNTVRGIRGESKKYQDMLLNGDFDVIMNYAAQQWATDLAFEVIDKVKAAKILVPCGFSGLYDASYKDYFKKMPHIMKKYDATVYMSDDYRDINFAHEHKIKNTHLIPNGAGADEFGHKSGFSIRQKLGIPEDHLLILSVGSHTGMKGHSEAIQIFQQADIHRASLLMVANDFGVGCSKACKRSVLRSKVLPSYRKAQKKLLVKDLDRNLTVAAYQQADIFLFPSNIEASPLVLFEAMAANLPFLTTDVGNSAEIIKWSKGGVLLPTRVSKDGLSHADINKSAQLLTEWALNSKYRKTFATRGHAVWQKKFTWEIITKQYDKLYREVLAK